MDDLISRQAAIDAINKAFERVFVWDGTGPLGDKVLENVPSAQPEPQWIPCSERLPKRDEDVLVTRFYDGREDFQKSCRYVEVASRYGEDDDVVWNSYSDEYKMSPKNHKVIAWMPLPECYRGENDG